MLLGMQGLFAEYDRIKITERTRKGKLYWAKTGALVGKYAPYGYRFVRRTETQRATMEPEEEHDLVEKAVWDAVAEALQHPERLASEYERSLSTAGVASSLEAELKQANVALKQLSAQEDRLTTAYLDEA